MQVFFKYIFKKLYLHKYIRYIEELSEYCLRIREISIPETWIAKESERDKVEALFIWSRMK
jgi:hypothetical protein